MANAQFSYLLHDDYENFARYLGVEYEDLVNLEFGYSGDEDDTKLVEYEIPSLF